MEVRIVIELMEKRKKLIRIFGDKFVENNKGLEININGNKINLIKLYKLDDDEVNNLIIEFKDNNIIDISYMFAGCEDFEYIDIFWPDTSKIININYIFQNCKNLKDIFISAKWNIEKINSIVWC